MEWVYITTVLALCFGLGFFFGVYFAPVSKVDNSKSRMATMKERAELAIFGKIKAYSPSNDANRQLDSLDYSYYDSVDKTKQP
jgi:hypothetical protein